MWMLIIFQLTVLLANFVQSSDVDSKLAELDAKLVQLDAKNAKLEEKNSQLESKIIHLEKVIKGDKEILSSLQEDRQIDHNQLINLESEIWSHKNRTRAGKGLLRRIQAVNTRVPGETQTAFTACLSRLTLENSGARQTVVFDQVITNVGHAYNPHDGEFTAPVDGVYAFHVSLFSEDNHAYFDIVVDGRTVGSMWVGAGYDPSSEFWLLQLNRGSEVWIITPAAGYRIHGYCFTKFSGYLVFET